MHLVINNFICNSIAFKFINYNFCVVLYYLFGHDGFYFSFILLIAIDCIN